MLAWEEEVLRKLSSDYRYYPDEQAAEYRFESGGIVGIWYDSHVEPGDPGLVIQACRPCGRWKPGVTQTGLHRYYEVKVWTPNSPEEFWQALRDAEDHARGSEALGTIPRPPLASWGLTTSSSCTVACLRRRPKRSAGEKGS